MALERERAHPLTLPAMGRTGYSSYRDNAVQGDKLRLISHDASWFVDAVVVFADDTRVTLGAIKRVDLPKAGDEASAHVVRWTRTGSGAFGYAIFERSTGRLISGPFSNLVAAQAATPKPQAA